jgi:hypothetical protein
MSHLSFNHHGPCHPSAVTCSFSSPDCHVLCHPLGFLWAPRALCTSPGARRTFYLALPARSLFAFLISLLFCEQL